jgi:hypothetical protein
MGVRAIVGYRDDLVVFTIYDREAAEQFLEEMRAAGIQATLAASTEEFVERARE